MSPRHIAFYGRKGVGVSTVAANVCAALAEAGQHPAVVCCRGDGTASRLLGERRPALTLRQGLNHRQDCAPDALCARGFRGSRTLETGAVQSAELDAVLRLAEATLVAVTPQIDIVLYDLADADLADLTLLQRRHALDGIVAVADSNPATLHSVNELFRELRRQSENQRPCGDVLLLGNQVSEPYAETLIDDFARQIRLESFATLPRSLVVTRSAFFGATVIDAAPRTRQAALYRCLAKIVAQSGVGTAQRPVPMDEAAFREWLLDWGERLFAYDEELLTGGAAI